MSTLTTRPLDCATIGVRDYGDDMARVHGDVTAPDADKRVFVVRELLSGHYLLAGGYNGWGTSLKRAQRFEDPLNAWGAARKQIYPCAIDVLCTEEE